MAHVNMGSVKTMEDVDITATNPYNSVKEDAEHKTTGIGLEDVVLYTKLILHITVGHMECLPIQTNTSGPQQMVTKRTQ